jgi:hypothetical protein
MERYKLSRTLKDFRRRLANYPPSALRAAKRALEAIELKHGIVYEPALHEIDAAQKELIIAQLQEMGATDAEIAEKLRRAGFE